MQNAHSGQSIDLTHVSKIWGETYAVDHLDLAVKPGEFTVLLGPSGCGKSTTLRLIAGLEPADTGDILIGDKRVNHLPPSKREIAMVFQSYALFPHLSVAENILFGLKVRRTAAADQRKRLNATAELLGLSDLLQRKPAQLSGGQQQRVALGRAIIAEKPICLMDEPLSNLDAKLRNSMRIEIRDLQQSLGFTMVYVTHDQAEAITMADQVVLMRDGKLEQSGSPREIYESPASTFVAGFIGTPPMNLIPASTLLEAAGQSGDESVSVGVRPEHVRIAQGNGFDAWVEHVEFMGADVLADCRIGDSPLVARVEGNTLLKPQSQIKLCWPPESMHFYDKHSGARTNAPSPLLNAINTHLPG